MSEEEFLELHPLDVAPQCDCGRWLVPALITPEDGIVFWICRYCLIMAEDTPGEAQLA